MLIRRKLVELLAVLDDELLLDLESAMIGASKASKALKMTGEDMTDDQSSVAEELRRFGEKCEQFISSVHPYSL